MEYAPVSGAAIKDFLRSKGFERIGEAGFSTHFLPNTDSPEIDLDVDSAMIDLNHLVQDWTTDGYGELAQELLHYLGMTNY